jgi:hypothetical protein
MHGRLEQLMSLISIYLFTFAVLVIIGAFMKEQDPVYV